MDNNSKEHLIALVNENHNQAHPAIIRRYNLSLVFYAKQFGIGYNESEAMVTAVFDELFGQLKTLVPLNSADDLTNRLFISIHNAVAIKVPGLLSTAARDPDAATGPLINDSINANMVDLIFLAAGALPAQEKQVFDMYFVEGLSRHDIGTALQWTPAEVKACIAKAIDWIQERFRSDFPTG